MAYSHDGEGLHRAVDPEDKQAYVYAMTFLDAAPRVFGCFDQPDLKAPYTMRVTAPDDWMVLGNGRADAGRTRPLGAGRDQAAGDLLRHHRRRPLPLDHVRARRHRARPALPAVACARTSTRTPTSCSTVTGAGIRRVPSTVRHPLSLRRLPPGLLPGVQRRRDGEPRLRHALATPSSSRRCRPHTLRGTQSRDRRARDGAPVVRRPRHDEVVGRPLAQRVVRRLHGLPRHQRRDAVQRGVGRVRLHPQGMGHGRRPAVVDPPDRRQRRPRHPGGAGRLRRDLLLQGRRGAAPAQQVPRRRGVPRRVFAPTSNGTPTATPGSTTCSQAWDEASDVDVRAWADAWLRTVRHRHV